MRFKKMVAVILSMVMIISSSALSFAGSVVSDTSPDVNKVMISPEVGNYVGVDAYADGEKTIAQLGGLGQAKNATELQNSGNGEIEVHVDNNISSVNSANYGDTASRNATIQVSYNGELLDTIPLGEERKYYVKRADTLVLKAYEQTEAEKEGDIGLFLEYKRGNWYKVLKAKTEAVVVDLSYQGLDMIKGIDGNVSQTYKNIYIRPCDLNENLANQYDYVEENIGGKYFLADDYNGAFGINHLTGKVYIIDPKKFSDSYRKYKAQTVNYFRKFIKSKDVYQYGLSYLMTKDEQDKVGFIISEEEINLEENFEISFRAFFGAPKDLNGDGIIDDDEYKKNGEGMSFFLTPSAQNSPGVSGRNLGYRGTLKEEFRTDSFDIEFDTQYNKRNKNEFAFNSQGSYVDSNEVNNPASNVDPNDMGATHDNHMALNVNSNMNPNSSGKYGTRPIPYLRDADGNKVRYIPQLFEDGKYHNMSIKWNKYTGWLSVEMDKKLLGKARLDEMIGFDSNSAPGASNNDVYVLDEPNGEYYYKDGKWHYDPERLYLADHLLTLYYRKVWGKIHFGFTASTCTSNEWFGTFKNNYYLQSRWKENNDATARQIISKVAVITGDGKPHVIVEDREGNATDETFFFETEDAPNTSINKLIDHVQNILDHAKEGIGDDEIVENDKYDVGEYLFGSKKVLKAEMEHAIEVVEDKNSTKEQISAARLELQKKLIWFTSNQVTEDNKVDISTVSSETGEIFKTITEYAPKDTEIRLLLDSNPIRMAFKKWPADNNNDESDDYLEPIELAGFNIPTGYKVYVNPKNEKVGAVGDENVYLNSKADVLEKINFKFTNTPQTVGIMCREDDSSPTLNHDDEDFRQKAEDSIIDYAKNDYIPWKNDSSYDLNNDTNSKAYEDIDFLNILTNALKTEEDKKLVKPERVNYYISYIKSDLPKYKIEDYEGIIKMLKDDKDINDNFYDEDGSGKLTKIGSGGKPVYYQENIGTVAIFEAPDAGSDPTFNIEIGGNQYFGYSYPDVELYKLGKLDSIVGVSLGSYPTIPCDTTITDKVGGKGYNLKVTPENSDDFEENTIYAIRVNSRIQINNSKDTPTDKMVDKMIAWYKEMYTEYTANNNTDDLLDNGYSGKKSDIKAYELQYAVGSLVKYKFPGIPYNSDWENLQIKTSAKWFPDGDIRNKKVDEGVLDLNITNQMQLPGSF